MFFPSVGLCQRTDRKKYLKNFVGNKNSAQNWVHFTACHGRAFSWTCLCCLTLHKTVPFFSPIVAHNSWLSWLHATRSSPPSTEVIHGSNWCFFFTNKCGHQSSLFDIGKMVAALCFGSFVKCTIVKYAIYQKIYLKWRMRQWSTFKNILENFEPCQKIRFGNIFFFCSTIFYALGMARSHGLQILVKFQLSSPVFHKALQLKLRIIPVHLFGSV